MTSRLTISLLLAVSLVSGYCAWFLEAKRTTQFEQEINPSSISHKSGFSYTTQLRFSSDWLVLPTDSSDGKLSQLHVFEDGVPLGEQHTSHATIASVGKGKYSHWTSQTLYFSSTDGSDPRSNGKRYVVRSPLQAVPALTTAIRTSLAISTFTFLLFAVVLGARYAPQQGVKKWVVGGISGIACISGIMTIVLTLYPLPWRHTLDKKLLYHVDGAAYGYDITPPSSLLVVSSREMPLLTDGSGTSYSTASNIQELVAGSGGRLLTSNLAIIMSASDNSDPRSNGEMYFVIARVTPSPLLTIGLLFLVVIIGLLTYLPKRRGSAKVRP